jgi:hypothetical protein
MVACHRVTHMQTTSEITPDKLDQIAVDECMKSWPRNHLCLDTVVYLDPYLNLSSFFIVVVEHNVSVTERYVFLAILLDLVWLIPNHHIHHPITTISRRAFPPKGRFYGKRLTTDRVESCRQASVNNNHQHWNYCKSQFWWSWWCLVMSSNRRRRRHLLKSHIT